MDLNISNVINISVSQAQAGLGEYNTSNLALFTDDTAEASFGSDGYKIYLSPTEVGVDFGTDSRCFKMANAIFSQQPNILANRGYLVIFKYVGVETFGDAITRTSTLVQYFGAMSTTIMSPTDGQAAAAIVQPLNKIIGLVSRNEADLDEDGYFDTIRQSGLTKTRCLYYTADNNDDPVVMMASYFGRAFSTNFNGSNTTSTMHLKDLIGITPDTGLDQTLLTKAQAAGVDVYVSLEGVPKVYTSGANGFFDDVYNLAWFVGGLKVSGFNFLAQTSTKIAQTEAGVDGLKGAYRKVCEQGITNQYLAPGEWTDPNTFGNQADFLDNVRQRGYYIYSQPIAQQSKVSREARQAPLIQLAVKQAGAIHSSDIIVNINK